MKTLWRQVKRLCYRLVCWINYPTPRERMWHMYWMGKVQGEKEAYKKLPILQVQPKQQAQITEQLHLLPGEWTRLWREMHPGHRAAIPSQPAYWPAPFEAQMIKSSKNSHDNAPGLASEVTSDQLINNDSWLNSKPPIDVGHMTPAEIERVPTIRDLTGDLDENTKESPAIVALIHQGREQRRHAG